MKDPYKQEAENIIKQLDVENNDIKNWMTGATERLLKQQVEINSLKYTVYAMIFFIFILPIFLGMGAGK